jgi:hypothetical protein
VQPDSQADLHVHTHPREQLSSRMQHLSLNIGWPPWMNPICKEVLCGLHSRPYRLCAALQALAAAWCAAHHNQHRLCWFLQTVK